MSVALAGLGAAAIWAVMPNSLSVTTDIVGSDIFSDFDVYRYTYGYYFIALLFPLAAIALYQLIARKEPLRYRGEPRSPMFPLTTVPEDGGDEPVPSPVQTFDQGPTSPPLGHVTSSESPETRLVAGAPRTTVIGGLWMGARIALPAAAIVIELSVIQVLNHRTGTSVGYLGGCLYVIAVIVVAMAFRHSSPRRAHSPPSFRSTTLRPWLAWANSLLAVAVVPLIYFVSRSTAVAIGSERHVVRYPWLPWWFAALVTLACLIVWLRRARRAATPDDLLELEAGILMWVVGPVLLLLVLAFLPGAEGYFQAFDDAQYLATPQLIFQHGLFPWRDIYVLHGLLQDVFDGKIGMILFGNTRWGAKAGISLIVDPVNWVVLYGFTAYFCRKNRLILIGLSIAIACGLLQGLFADRFVLLPMFLVAFDLVLRRPTWRRCWLFMAILLIGAILTPEEALFVPCLMAVLVLFEAAGHRRGQPFRSSFTRILRCAIAGSVLVAAWFAFLAGTRSLGAFFDYYRVFASGHNLEGAYQTQWVLSKQLMITFEWTIPTVLWLATVWRVVAKLRLRSVWSVADWVMVAAALISVLYFPKALDRADYGHVGESFAVAVPLLILWSVELLTVADRSIRSATHRLPRRLHFSQFRHAATFGAVLAIVAGTTAQTTVSTVLAQVPADFHPVIPTSALTAFPRLGYTSPGTVATNQIRALGLMLDRYAGPSAPVFDYSNEPGILYYLLNRVPGTRFYYSAVVQTPLAQQEEIADLQDSRPPVVIFSNPTYGLTYYDGVPQSLRSYDVSKYLFAHYKPLLDVQGQLLLLRNDLFASAPPVPIGLVTTDLYFDTPACTFGDIPNFFALPANISTRPSVRVPSEEAANSTSTITGWAVNSVTKAPATEVFAVADGRIVATAVPTLPDLDVVYGLRDPSAFHSGFAMTVQSSSEPIELYSLNSDGSVSPLAPARGVGHNVVSTAPLTTITSQAGQVLPVTVNGSVGRVDAVVNDELITIQLPKNPSSASFDWIELKGSSAFGTSSFTLTNDPSAASGHFIQFNTLPRVGHQVYVGVGSCLQWQGFGAAKQLYLLGTGNRPLPSLSVFLVK